LAIDSSRIDCLLLGIGCVKEALVEWGDFLSYFKKILQYC